MEPPIAPARVVKVLGRVGARGLMTAVRVELLRFPRIQMLRAVKGPVRLGDIINIEEALEDVRRPM
ncbi:40S ribosomal protein S28 [Drosophila novamexicana]|uniref:40S ribosomal protein S28 n=1 Tax=Drosophila novamexicana TaxID=47314 RepID=UPI0011E5B09C|nr:40S ribosomal protein S28 [Drosophila novamexicana]